MQRVLRLDDLPKSLHHLRSSLPVLVTVWVTEMVVKAISEHTSQFCECKTRVDPSQDTIKKHSSGSPHHCQSSTQDSDDRTTNYTTAGTQDSGDRTAN